MYRQPENTNRVKSMKSKFEDLNDSTTNTQKLNDKFKKTNYIQNKLTSKPPVALLNTKTCEILTHKLENNNEIRRSTNKSKENNNENIKIDRKSKTMKPEDTFRNKNKFEEKSNGKKDFSDINKKELCNAPPLNLTRQLNDPSKKGCIKRTPAFRKDKIIGKTKVNDDLSFANIVHMFENNDKTTCDTVDANDMTKILTRTYCSDSEIKTEKNKIICKPKKNVTSTVSLNGLTLKFKTENDKNIVNKSILTASTSLGLENEKINRITQIKQKSLSPIILKKATENNLFNEIANISSTSTLKLSEKENNTKSRANELLDNICNKQHEKETKVAYAQVNKPKKSTVQENKNVTLTDTLKAALKQPLPTGPPPKKPPRTFAHTPNSRSPSTSTKFDEISCSSTPDTSSINEKLNECLTNALKAKNAESNNKANNNKSTKIKSDPKLMLQKLENALLNNKIKSPKLPRKLKSTFDGASSPKASTSSCTQHHQSTTQPNIYTSETPQKNLFPNCLPSLNCVTNTNATSATSSSSSYTKVTGTTTTTSNNANGMSTFFTEYKGNKQEPIYAEPFHFKTTSESPKLSRISNKFDTSTNSLHYMSNPIAEWNSTPNKTECSSVSVADDKDITLLGNTTSNSKSDKSVSCNESGPLTRHKLNLIMNNTYATPSPTDSDIDSLPSTPSSEDTPNSKRATIKDLILNFEQKNQIEPNSLHIPSSSSSSNGKSRLAASSSWHELTETQNTSEINQSKNATKEMMDPDSIEERKKMKTQLSRKLTERRKTYVRRVCSTLRRKSDLKPLEKQLFECCLLVGLNVATLTPYIKNKFPPNYEVPAWVEHLCFPDATEWSAKLSTIPNIQSQDCQCYSLVITNDKGDRKFGYCRRVVPEQTYVCLPLTYCIISSYRATGFYHKVLQELESRHGLPFALQEAFLQKLYHCKFPEPGESVSVPCSLRSLVVESCNDLIQSNQITNPDSIECISRIANVQNSAAHIYGQLNKISERNTNDWVLVDQSKSEENCDFKSPKITYGSVDESKINQDYSQVVRRLNPNNSFTTCSNSSTSSCSSNSNNNNHNNKRNGHVFINDTSENIRISDNLKTSDNSQYPLLNLPNNQLLNDCLIGDVVLKRPYDTRLEDVDLTMLFNTLDLTTLLQTFGSLLHERKVVFISNCLSKLSSCVEALQSILYPFSWQHTFIPVLSNNMLDILSAPLPLISGVLASHITETLTIDEGIAVNLDTSTLVCYMGDESDIIPKRLQKGLNVALQLVTEATQSDDRSRNVLVSEAFIRMFLEVCGTYKQFIVANDNGLKTFERELFIKHHQAKCVNLFLEWFTETAMFHNFIQSRLSSSEPTESMFEQRCVEFNCEKNSAALLRNSKVSYKMKLFTNKLFH